MRESERLKGVCPILPTPYDESGALDCESLRREVRFLLRAGVRGIALFGNASEAFALTPGEKERIAVTVAEETAGRVPLVFGAGGTGTEPAVENSRWAQAHGAALLMIMPPYMIKPDAQRIYEYYAEIAKNVEIPIMIQDAPGACGVSIPIEIILRLADTFENICYVKAEAPPTFQKAKKILEASEGRLTVFGGLNGTFFYEELCMGVSGTMPAGEFPEIMVQVYDRFVSGDTRGARQLFYRYLPFIRLGSIPGGMAMAVHKEVLRRGGIIRTAKVRNPYIPADEGLLEVLDHTLEDLELMALSQKQDGFLT